MNKQESPAELKVGGIYSVIQGNIAVAIIAVFVFIGCGRNPYDRLIEINGAAGRAVHDKSAKVVKDQYVLEYAIKNVSNKELTFDRIEEIW